MPTVSSNAVIKTFGVKLQGKKTGDVDFVDLIPIKEVPSLGGNPDRIDITTLSDTMKTYALGIPDAPELTFTYNYNKTNKTLVDGYCNDATVKWRIVLPDGTEAFEWTGEAKTWVETDNNIFVGKLYVATSTPIVIVTVP